MHERRPASGLMELNWWTLDQLLDAHIALDIHDEVERKSYEKAEREARARARE